MSNDRKKSLVVTLGSGDWERGFRWPLMRTLRLFLLEAGWELGLDFKGTNVADGWALAPASQIEKGAYIGWHPPNMVTRTLGHPDNPMPEELIKCAKDFLLIRQAVSLEHMTVHLVSFSDEEPDRDTDAKIRFSLKITPEDLLGLIQREIDVLCEIVNIMGEGLALENTDMIQFIDKGRRLPIFLEKYRTGFPSCVTYIAQEITRRTGVKVSRIYDIEHGIGYDNFVCRRRDMADFMWYEPQRPTVAQTKLADITGCWFETGEIPNLVKKPKYESDQVRDIEVVINVLEIMEPELLHYGASVQPARYNTVLSRDEIDTHLPPNPADYDQMALLDVLLGYVENHPDCRGIENEVVGHDFKVGTYDPWSPREFDHEMAMLSASKTVIDRIIQRHKARQE